jgi:NADPH2:quinone reductase
MVTFGQSSGKIAPMDTQLLSARGSLFLTRPTLWHYIADRPSLLARAGDLFDWIGSGKLFVYISQVLPLERAADAHRLLEGRQTMGKLLLSPLSRS